jgi:N-acetylneuraminate synthase
MKIADRTIDIDSRPYIVAEISANHLGKLDNALRLIELAGQAGADAVKLQTYTADTITINHDGAEFRISGGLWDGRTLYDLYQEAHTPWEWHKPLFEKGKEVGITIFSSPFDASAVDFLEELDCPAYKIASFEAIDLPLIAKTAATGKPLIISTGMANLEEISEAVEVARSNGCKELALLHCISGYPTPVGEVNLKTLVDMQKRFNVVTGFSDHTVDKIVAPAAVAIGARIIEKHLILDRKLGGPDAPFSIEPSELTELVNACHAAWQASGSVSYDPAPSERPNLQFRRSLYVIKDMQAGDQFTSENIRSIRPNSGLPPKYLPEILGKRVNRAVKKGTPVKWDIVSK